MSQSNMHTPRAGRVALVTGVTGQDGSYLAELLLDKGYAVYGVIRRSSNFNTVRIEHVMPNPRFKLVYGDVTDASRMHALVAELRPHELYNLAAQSHVKVSFDCPDYTAQVDALGTLNLLEAIRAAGLAHSCRFYQASTSELYGLVQETPQSETTPFYPRSPYAVAKLYSFWLVKNYREAHGMYAVNGVLFNHESPRRGRTFVTRKITRAVTAIVQGKQQELVLGNLSSLRDWGHAAEYVEGMWRMLQQDAPDDFVLATGRTTSVRRFVELAFAAAGWTICWRGEGVEEVGYRQEEPHRVLVRVDKAYFRPTEVDLLLGDASKAERVLGWKARVTLEQLVQEMIQADMRDNEM